MLPRKMFSCSILTTCLVLSTQFHDAVAASTDGGTRPYSAWMADSVISRGQAITAPGADSSIYLQIGFFQTAVLRLMKSPAADYAEEDWESYLERSSDSVVQRLLNATQDTKYPMDRLSIGRSLLPQYACQPSLF